MVISVPQQSGVISLGFIVMLVLLVTTIVIAVLVIKQRRHCFHSKLYSLDLLGKCHPVW